MAGVSRSVTLVIAYIMQKSDASFSSAFNYVKSKRPIVKFLSKKDSSK
jgi:protein-tyrosine phosphatase